MSSITPMTPIGSKPERTLMVIAKQPIPGRVKTRLSPQFTPSEAAQLAAAALRDSIAVIDATPAAHRVLLFDGDPAGWAPPLWTVVAQCRGPLDVRLSSGFAAIAADQSDRHPVEHVARPVVLVGMDTPQLRPEQLAFDSERYDSCLGLAADGGFWAIGFRDPRMAESVMLGVPMSVAHTGAEQHRRLREGGLSVQLLEELRDFDTPADARAIALAEPRTRFAQAWRDITGINWGDTIDADYAASIGG